MARIGAVYATATATATIGEPKNVEAATSVNAGDPDTR